MANKWVMQKVVVYHKWNETPNIAFARGGAHLPIVYALRLPKTDMILWGGDFLDAFVIGGNQLSVNWVL